MVNYLDTGCRFHMGRVLCGDITKCANCGWNPAVNADRVRRLRLYGRRALVRNDVMELQPDPETEARIRFMLANYREYGGDMSLDELRINMGVNSKLFGEVRAAAKEKVSSIIREALECM